MIYDSRELVACEFAASRETHAARAAKCRGEKKEKKTERKSEKWGNIESKGEVRAKGGEIKRRIAREKRRGPVVSRDNGLFKYLHRHRR